MLILPKSYTSQTPDELSAYLHQNPGTPIYYHDVTGVDTELGHLSVGYEGYDSDEKYVFFEGLDENQHAESPYWPLKVFFALLADETTTPQYLFRCAKNCSYVECLDAHTPLEAFECSLEYRHLPKRGRTQKMLNLPAGYICVQVCSSDDVNIYLIIKTKPPVLYDELASM